MCSGWGRKRGGQRKSWIGNIEEWTGLNFSTILRHAEEREAWLAFCVDVAKVAPLRP